ncbi:hypothetical protein PHISCL_03714 [Aspergillus sclerotialis]|uniref:DUF7708 domain-containing protein n=1 Tax=Aspergillus sclerotialis TaxID=2070753 RepID=A0A3A3A1D4_9EURO|nr:hypothetical protein PHISCL_03714 [Aspergillus sclerotialis]
MSGLEQADPGPSSGLIRRFSDKLSETSPSEPLSRGLAAKVAVDRNRERSLQHEWDRLLLDGRELAESVVQDEEAVLLDQSRRLYSAWKKFQDSLPKDQRIQLGSHDRPDVKYLVETVSRASATWQADREKTKSGKLKHKFSNLCETCKNHSTLLSVIPKDDKYVTLLTGSLSAIAQASINHQNIAEGVVDTLDELSQDIDFWNRQMAEHGNIPELRRYIQELYVVMFEYFTEIFIRWSKSGWKRFLTSFDEGAFNRLFTERRNRITAIERRMERHVTLDFQHRTRVSTEKLVQSQQELLTSLPEKLDSQRRLLGSSLQLLLEQQKQWIPELPRPESPAALLQSSPVVISQEPSVENNPIPEKNQIKKSRHRFSRADIQAELTLFMERLRDQMGQLIQTTHHASLLQIDQHVHRQLKIWLKSSESTSLWIQGPHGVPRPSQNSMTAVSITALSGANDIPCISYFFSLTDPARSKMSNSEALRMFLASLVTQLTKFIPEHGYSRASLEPSRFAALTQNNLTVDETLQLIYDVREIGPRYVHGVIDNFQLLEDRSDTAFTRDLLKTIGILCRLDYGNQYEDNGEGREPATRTRMCFTTDGYMDGLSQATALELITKVEYDLEANDTVKGEIVEVVDWDKGESDDL